MDTPAIKAMQLIVGNLEAAVNNGPGENALNNMSEGALLAGYTFGNAALVTIYTFVYPLIAP